MKVSLYEWGSVKDDRLLYAVIFARYKGKWIMVRNRERVTWEVPGGRREPGEPIEGTARRELWEETGAVEFVLRPLFWYSVKREAEEETFGAVYAAEVSELGELPESEIAETSLVEGLPEAMTYPQIQPFLWSRVMELL